MKNPSKRKNKVNKGAPSGIVISLIVHAVAFFVAGLFVVFTVLPKPPPAFDIPPPFERPKMKLKKPKVKIKKSSQPKPSSRIVAKVKTAKMPEIQLPDLMGSGEGLLAGLGAGGGGDFMDIPELGNDVFGSSLSTGNDFVGIFYDLKRYRDGRSTSMGSRNFGGDEFIAKLYKFLKSNMDPSVLGSYYRSPKKLYATTLAMPINLSLMAPSSFGCPDTLGCLWLVHYKGKLVYHEDIRFRFRCAADDLMSVMVDGEYVIQSQTWGRNGPDASRLDEIWDRDPLPIYYGRQKVVVGDWIELKAGAPRDMEVAVAEIPGGTFQAILTVEVDGVEYPLNDQGGPILPIFKTEPVARDLADAIHSMSVPDEFCVTNGPIFSDIKFENIPYYANNGDEPVDEAAEPTDSRETRTWKLSDGREIEGSLRTILADAVLLDTPQNKNIKLPLKDLSEEDCKYVDMENPPEFRFKFITGRNQVPAPDQPPDTWQRPITIIEYQFGVKATQISSGYYPYPLTVEYFVFADENDGDNYRLLEYCSSRFTPSRENGRSHTFRGKKLRTQRQSINPNAPYRGYDYKGHLIVITDERGKVIQYDGTRKFLYPNLDALRKLRPGNHFNEECHRVTPARPKEGSQRV